MKQFLLLVLMGLSLSSYSQTQKHFDFGVGKKHKDYTSVLATDLYSDTKGYGFESIDGLLAIDRGGKNISSDFITSSKPFYFSVQLPEGNYNVKVYLGDKKGSSSTTIRVECRRLMVEKITTFPGKIKTASFMVHIRDTFNRANNTTVKIKPRERNNFYWDNKLTFEFNNVEAKIAAIDIEKDEKLPTIFLAGNSTVVDQENEPWCSWGQMFPSFFKPNTVVIANYAESGETLKAFEKEGRLAKIWSLAKSGDYLFIEFAHNDQKPGPNYLDPFTSYQATLSAWVNKAIAKGMHPVFVTSTNRRTFDSTGHIYNSLGDYPEAMRQLATQLKIPVIDLNKMSKTFYEALGPIQSTKAFVYFKANAYPNAQKDVMDNTHFNTYGAYQLAKSVSKGIHENIPLLAKYLLKELKNYNPANPDNPSDWHLPEGLYMTSLKPDGN